MKKKPVWWENIKSFIAGAFAVICTLAVMIGFALFYLCIALVPVAIVALAIKFLFFS